MSETEMLKVRIRAFVARMTADGFGKSEIGAAMVGYGAGLVWHHAPEDMDGLILGIQDAIMHDGETVN